MYRYPKLATRIKKPDPEPIARKLVKDWSVDKQGLGISFEDRPSIYVKDTTTPANDTDITLEKDGLDTFSSFFTYTNPSIKNVRQADGDLKYAAHNLFTYSEDFSQSAWTKTNVTVNTDQTTSPDGETTADQIVQDGTTNSHLIAQNESSATGITFKFSIRVKYVDWQWVQICFGASDVTGDPRCNFDIQNGSIGTDDTGNASIVGLGDGWYLISTEVTALLPVFDCYVAFVQSTSAARLESFAGDSSSSFYAWGAQLNAYPADTTYLATTSATRYAIPLQYDLGNKAEGVLIEPAATNTISYSQEFDDTATGYWTNNNTATLSVDASGPDGTTSATTLVDSSATGTGTVNVLRGVTVSTSTSYTWSVYAKADQLSWCLLYCDAFTTPANDGYYFDLGTGSIGSAFSVGTGITPHIEDAGNGWYRCSISFTTDSSDTSGSVRVQVASGDGVATVDLDGTSSILIYGAQLEQGFAATSLVKTFGATATRAGDQITKSTSSIPLSSTRNHTQYAKFEPKPFPTTASVIAEIRGSDNNKVCSLSSTGSNPRFTGYNFGSYYDDETITTSPIVAGSTSKVAAQWSSDDCLGSIDGILGTPDRAGIPVDSSLLTAVNFGQRINTLHRNCLFKEYAYFPQKTSPDRLQDLTGGVAETAWRGPKAQYWVDGEPDALSIDFTDDHFKTHGNSDFYGSCWVLQSSQASYREDFNGVPTDFLTYTSPSAKNIICDDGNLKYAPHNLNVENSEQLDSSGGYSELNVTTTTGAATAPNGTVTATLIEDNATSGVHSVTTISLPTVVAGQRYRASVAAKNVDHDYAGISISTNASSNEWVTIRINLSTGAIDGSDAVGGGVLLDSGVEDLGDGWKRYWLEGTLSNSAAGWAIVYLADDATTFSASLRGRQTYSGSATGAYFWGLQVSVAPADTSYVPTTTASAYALPIEFYPSGTIKGLLAERAATNLASDSQDFTGAAWTPLNETLTQNATGPDGVANSAWTFAHDGVAGAGVAVVLSDTVSVSTSTAYTFSVYAKSGTVDFIALRTNSFTTPGDVYSYFNLSTGVVASEGSGHTGSIENVGNGWYRCAITFTTDVADTGGILRIHLAQADLDSLCDSGDNVLIYGAQFETGSVATSLIKTYGASATRAADAQTFALSSIPWNNETFSMYIEYNSIIEGTGGSIGILGISGDLDTFAYKNSGVASLASYDGSNVLGLPSHTANETSRVAIGFTPGDNRGYRNAGAGTASSATFDFVESGDVLIGNRLGGTSAEGVLHVRRIVYIPNRRLVDADLDTWSDTGELP